jgi:hypothetical protein
MANWIYVCCRSTASLSYAQLEDLMGHMGFLDHPAVFEPPIDERNRVDPEWSSFTVRYDPKKRRIVVRHLTSDAELAPILEDLRDMISGAEPDARRGEVVERLDSLAQAYTFELPDDLPDDVWEMLDMTESFIARERDGIVIAEDGAYDANLKPIMKWS